jgi:hypothetical protein
MKKSNAFYFALLIIFFGLFQGIETQSQNFINESRYRLSDELHDNSMIRLSGEHKVLYENENGYMEFLDSGAVKSKGFAGGPMIYDVADEVEKGILIIKLTENSVSRLSFDFQAEINTRFGIRELDEIIQSRGEVQKITQLHPLPPKMKTTAAEAERLELTRIFRIKYVEPKSRDDLDEIISQVESIAEVEYCEPSYIYRTCAKPNDTNYSSLFHLPQIKADSAWDIHKGENGTDEVVIGICDSGTEWFHSDLIDNLYRNLGEDADGDGVVIEYVNGQWQLDSGDINNKDDDGNGRVDDLIGWNFYTNDGTTPNDPNASTDNPHGTHVAGIAAGVTNNNNGIASVSWNVKFLPTKHGSNNSGTAIYYGYDGITYLVDSDVDIINCSWGGSSYSSYGQDVINYAEAAGVFVVAAAGNGNTSDPHYPSSYAGVISVASVNSADQKTYYSHYGSTVDLCAPGGESGKDAMIKSTVPGNSYNNFQGTSMASPLAAGALALLKSYRSNWSNDSLLQHFYMTADDISAKNTQYSEQLGQGRVNIFKALKMPFTGYPKKLRIVKSSESSVGFPIAGDTMEVKCSFKNNNPFYGDADLSYVVTTSSTDISILKDSDTLEIEKAGIDTEISFTIVVDSNAVNQEGEFTVTFISDNGFDYGQIQKIDFIGILPTKDKQLLYEGFESTSMPPGWSEEIVFGTENWVFGVAGGSSGKPASARTGEGNARLYTYYCGPDEISMLVTPKIKTNTGTGLAFSHAQSNRTNAMFDSLLIYCKRDNAPEWELYAKFKKEEQEWKDRIIYFPPVEKNIQFAFCGYAGNGYGVVLDNVYSFEYEEPNLPVDTDDDGYKNISSFEQLRWLSEHDYAYCWNIELDNDINAAGSKKINVGDHDENPSTMNTAMGWLPLGYYCKDNDFNYVTYTGKIEGHNFKIDSLYINRPNMNYVGLCGILIGGAVSNLNITNCDILGASYVGAFAGKLINSTIIRTDVSGKVEAVNDICGGIGGYSDNSVIVQSFSNASVNGGHSVGGLVGNNSGYIQASAASGSVIGLSKGIGGLVGHNQKVITECFSTTFVSLPFGLCGGLVGSNYGKIFSCFWDKNTSGQQESNGGFGKTTAEMKQKSTYTDEGWNFDYIWKIDSGYPYIEIDTNFRPADIDNDGFINIRTLDDLNWIAETAVDFNLNYELDNNINASDSKDHFHTLGFLPIGYPGYGFNGIFEGNDFTIDSLFIQRPYQENIGLFGVTDSGTVKNLKVENAKISGYRRVGSVVGTNSSCELLNIHCSGDLLGDGLMGGLIGCNYGYISHCSADGVINGGSALGGFVGINYKDINQSVSKSIVSGYRGAIGGFAGLSHTYSKISNCHAAGQAGMAPTTYGLGGFIGEQNGSAEIFRCSASGDVKGGHNIGGFCGFNRTACSITESSATGKVSGCYLENSGGFCGKNWGLISSCYTRSDVSGRENIGGFVGYSSQTVKGSYAAGGLSGSNDELGGFSAAGSRNVSFSLWDIEKSGCTTSFLGKGLTTAYMKTKSTFTNKGWDFDSVWAISPDINSGYPYFRWEELNQPKLIAPPNNKNNNILNAETLIWQHEIFVDRYELLIAEDPNFTNVVFVDSNRVQSEYNLKSKFLAECFKAGYDSLFWKVRARSTKDTSDWSETRIFVLIHTPLDIPELISPADSDKELDLSLTFDWSDITNTDKYILRVSEESGLDPDGVVIEKEIIASEYVSLQGELAYNKKYYWKVLAINSVDTSDWSEVRTFSTKTKIDSPELLVPEDSATAVLPDVTIKWTSVDYADTYQLEISDDSNFVNLHTNLDGLDSTQFDCGTNLLRYGTKYYWRVKAKNNGGIESEYTEIYSFRTKTLDAPTLAFPEDEATDLYVPRIELIWNAVEEAESYILKIADDSSFEPNDIVFSETTSSTSALFEGLSMSSTYYWRVASINSIDTSTWSEARTFSTIPVLEVPELLIPADNAIEILPEITLEWAEVNNANSYQLQISEDSCFSHPVIKNDTLFSEQFDCSSLKLKYGTQYYWRVKAKRNLGDESEWSAVYAFRTKVLDSPSLVSPANEADNQDVTGVMLVWNSVDLAETYLLKVSDNPDFSAGNIVYTETTSDTVAKTIGLTQGTEYYWRLITNAASGESSGEANAEVRSFRTEAIGVPDLVLPSNNECRIAVEPSFTWEALPNVDLYELEVSKSSDFRAALYQYSGNSTSITIPGSDALEEGVTYYWRVRGVIAGTYFGEWSATSAFLTEIPVNLLSPTDDANSISRNNPIFKWNDISVATKYRIQIANSSTFDTGTLLYDEEVYDSSYKALYLNKNTEYYWRVRAFICSEWCDYTSPRAFTTEDFDAPKLYLPTDGKQEVSVNPEMTWQLIVEADYYDIEISESSDFSNPVRIDTSAANKQKVTGLNYISDYYWRVRAVNSHENGAWSSTYSFKTEFASCVWSPTVTNYVHEVKIPASVNPTVYGRDLDYHDYVGVFYDSCGTSVCAGVNQWTGLTLRLNVYGDDPTTPQKEGFAEGEELQFYIWDSFRSRELQATHSIFSGDSAFAVGTTTILDSLYVGAGDDYHNFILPAGWSMVSSYIKPDESAIDSIFSDTPNLFLTKNGAGKIYLPDYGIDQIKNWNYKDGYLLYLNSSDNLSIGGKQVVPENEVIPLNKNWNMVAYLCNKPGAITTVLDSIYSNIFLIKNGSGQITLPAYGIDQIQMLNPGEGYLIYMNAPDTLIYPPNSSFKPLAKRPFPTPKYLITKPNALNNAHLILKTDLNDGTEIGVYNESNDLVGAGVVESGSAVVTVFGTNEYDFEFRGARTGELLTLKAFRPESKTYPDLDITDIISLLGSEKTELQYESNSVLCGKIETTLHINHATSISIAPNPASDEFSISIQTGSQSKIGDGLLSIFDNTGKEVAVIHKGEINEDAVYKYNCRNLPNGSYTVVLSYDNNKAIAKVIVKK